MLLVRQLFFGRVGGTNGVGGALIGVVTVCA